MFVLAGDVGGELDYFISLLNTRAQSGVVTDQQETEKHNCTAVHYTETLPAIYHFKDFRLAG
jgi:hypothetical protein